MGSPNSRGNRAPIRYLSLPNENSRARNQLKAKGPMGTPTTQAIDNAFDQAPQTVGKIPLLKTIPTHSLSAEKLIWCLPRTFMPSDQCLQYWKVFCILPEEKGEHQPSYSPEIYKCDMLARCAGAIVAQSFWEQPMILICLKTHSMRRDPYIMLLGQQRN